MKRLAATISLCMMAVSVPGAPAVQAQATPAGQTSPASQPRTTHMTSDPALLHPATLTAKSPETYQVKFVTTKGDFVVDVTRAWAPLGADRFYNLVKHGFFTDAAFFRNVPGFIVQFGLSADPGVNKVWQSANIKDDSKKESNAPGTITFATAGPNTRTTQLFINFGNNTFLDSQGFTPFGKVTSGMDVVQKLYSGYGERPDQGAITSQGKAYLDKNFPNIDMIKSATIVSPAAN
ncbi:MAG TPA: peptidylprolyl isomerase [Candidatus Cybelea sp.]|jgi:peptidyl-prolyl cis-trans isomerase A (cyclophilin A)|nr:peptidylprolyl isomerase [Candidatus Cybelea sp.]